MKKLEIHLDHFMLFCDSKNLSKKTLKSYDQSLKLFLMYLHNEHEVSEIEEITSFHIRSYIKYLRERGKYTITSNEQSLRITRQNKRYDVGKTISDTTIANYLRNIKVFFNFLFEEGELMKNPVKNIANIKPQRKSKKLLKQEDIKYFLDQLDITKFHEYRMKVMIIIMLDTGIRIGECVNLIPEDVDLKYNTILIRNPKNNQQRNVYYSQKTNKELKRWIKYKDRFNNSEYLFPTTKGTKLDINTFEASLRRRSQQTGIEITSHQLRNNFAKYYLMNGGDMASLSKILGHSSVDVTAKAYLDFDDEQLRSIHQQFSPIEKLKL